jgi:alcohol dehydrogenase class IV
LPKYAELGRLLADSSDLDDETARRRLLDILTEWTERLELPRIGRYGMTQADIPRVVANCRGSSMKTNPVVLSDEEVAGILEARL